MVIRFGLGTNCGDTELGVGGVDMWRCR